MFYTCDDKGDWWCQSNRHLPSHIFCVNIHEKYLYKTANGTKHNWYEEIKRENIRVVFCPLSHYPLPLGLHANYKKKPLIAACGGIAVATWTISSRSRSVMKMNGPSPKERSPNNWPYAAATLFQHVRRWYDVEPMSGKDPVSFTSDPRSGCDLYLPRQFPLFCNGFRPCITSEFHLIFIHSGAVIAAAIHTSKWIKTTQHFIKNNTH